MQIRHTLYLMSSRLRGLFFVILVICVLAMILYTHSLVSNLRKESRDLIEFYAFTTERIASDDISGEALSWLFENITQKTNFPLILTDDKKIPVSWKGIGISDTLKSTEALKQVESYLNEMQKEHQPVEIKYGDQVLNYLYFSDSRLIKQLVFLPYITIGALGILVLVAYLGFNSIKRSEQRFIWVGMAKETAHQLGTPISSLMGWLEFMKNSEFDTAKVRVIANDIEKDVSRLERVAARFSQIGSQSALKEQDIQVILDDIIAYFTRRLPQSGKEVRLVKNYGDVPKTSINKDLFEWAIENLVKNAIDAVKKTRGVIEITTGVSIETGRVYIDIRDNGVGISSKGKKEIFKAGFSTKKRGWGLGLNLAKRIIEDYHVGKLFIRDTQQGKGTTMRILL
jgi:signal transduction histidine kinase